MENRCRVVSEQKATWVKVKTASKPMRVFLEPSSSFYNFLLTCNKLSHIFVLVLGPLSTFCVIVD